MSSPAVQPLLALLASHVGGNPTQYMFEQAVAHHGLDWRYLTFEITPEQLGDAIRGLRVLGFRGGHCGDAHMQAVLSSIDRTTETAAAIGSANLLFREDNELVGDNTEGRGVLDALCGMIELAGKQIVLLGAGNMGRAVAVELARAGIGGITIVNRTESRAGELADLLKDKFAVAASAVAWQGDYAVAAEADILINATSLGQYFDETPLPLALDSLRPELLVVDAAISSPRTPLVEEAAKRGCKTIDGVSILIEQVSFDMQLWTGVDPSRQVLREAVEEFLEL